MPTYRVEVEVKGTVDYLVEADSEAEAKEIATAQFEVGEPPEAESVELGQITATEVEENSTPGTERIVAYIPTDSYVEGHGFRVSFVVEGEFGHRPTGNWPYKGGRGQVMPWFWGPTLEEAQAQADAYNEAQGISKMDAFIIVARSMVGKGGTNA